MVASRVAPTGDLARNPGMCPDWESNWQPFGLQPMLNPLSYASQVIFFFFFLDKEGGTVRAGASGGGRGEEKERERDTLT